MLKKKSNTSVESNTNLKLSIQFSLDGFSFCIHDITTNLDVFFTSYEFDTSLNSPKELLDRITELFKSDAHLQYDFETVIVIHQNNLNTLVPAKYFDEKSLLKYLDFNIKTLKTDFAAFDLLSSVEAYNVYIPYVNINNYLFQHFGEFEYKHHTTIAIDKILKSEFSKNGTAFFVNVEKNNFDIIVTQNNTLLLSNSFQYQNKEDFLYYLLFTAEQLQLDTNIFQLYFSGHISKSSDLYTLCYTYIKNITFLESKNPLCNNLDSPNYANFSLLYL